MQTGFNNNDCGCPGTGASTSNANSGDTQPMDCQPMDAQPVTDSCLPTQTIPIVVQVWDDPGCDGDNVVRVFNTDECVYKDGYFYWSLEDMNVDMPPSAKWSEPSTKCEMLKPVKGSQIGVDVHGNPIIADQTCLVTCATFDDLLGMFDGALSDTTQIGVDVSGNPVMAGDCFITCDDLVQALQDMGVMPSGVQIGVDAAGNPVMAGDCFVTCDDFGGDFTTDDSGNIALASTPAYVVTGGNCEDGLTFTSTTDPSDTCVIGGPSSSGSGGSDDSGGSCPCTWVEQGYYTPVAGQGLTLPDGEYHYYEQTTETGPGGEDNIDVTYSETFTMPSGSCITVEGPTPRVKNTEPNPNAGSNTYDVRGTLYKKECS